MPSTARSQNAPQDPAQVGDGVAWCGATVQSFEQNVETANTVGAWINSYIFPTANMDDSHWVGFKQPELSWLYQGTKVGQPVTGPSIIAMVGTIWDQCRNGGGGALPNKPFMDQFRQKCSNIGHVLVGVKQIDNNNNFALCAPAVTITSAD